MKNFDTRTECPGCRETHAETLLTLPYDQGAL